MPFKTIQAFVSTCAVALCIASVPVGAANQCKGKAEQACAADSGCAWVDSYTRKDGRTVSSHCKRRPQRSSAIGSDRMTAMHPDGRG